MFRMHCIARWCVVATLATVSWLASAGERAPLQIDCAHEPERCPRIDIAGDRPSAAPTFTGFADPALQADPGTPGRLWMVYSHLRGRVATGAGGAKVGVPHVATRLARSDDGGRQWKFVRTLWDSALTDDPEGQGPPSYFGSETAGLVARRDADGTTWFGVRLSYFLEPVTAYAPRYATSWTVRVSAARGDTPQALAGVDEAVLGSATTHATYGPHVRLTSLAPALRDCGIWNNPALALDGNRLYLVLECMAFDGKTASAARSRIVVFRTTPEGSASTWRWEYVGVLADATLARALSAERLVSPNVSYSADGTRLLTVTPQVGGVGQGCVVLALDSLDPPGVRESDGRPVVRARQRAAGTKRWHTGACTHDAASATGVVTVAATTAKGLQAELRATGLRP
jgi:hypothetical protein